MKVLVNVALSLILCVILITPMVLSFVLVGNPHSGAVAGAQSVTGKDVNIIPNTSSFSDYVSFSPQEFVNSEYKDTLGVTVFQRQRASYFGVYGIYNLSPSDDLYATISIDGEITTSDFEKIKVRFSTTESAVTLSQDQSVGDTLLYLNGSHRFSEGERMLIDDEVLEIVDISTDGLVVTPLMHNHKQGSFLEHESLLIMNGLVKNPRTQTQKILPSSELLVDVIVDGNAELLGGDPMVDIPISIKFSRTP